MTNWRELAVMVGGAVLTLLVIFGALAFEAWIDYQLELNK